MKTFAVLFAARFAAAAGASAQSTCRHIKDEYTDGSCCGNRETRIQHQLIPMPDKRYNKINRASNPCAGKNPNWVNINCASPSVLEQAGADITEGYVGTMAKKFDPITQPYWKLAMCPVNVHWHVGAEHRSGGEFEEAFDAKGPARKAVSHLNNPDKYRRGFRCNHYDANDEKFTTRYNWKFCKDMVVGETYEIHWPHSALGACGTTDQYQSPFYDGVFCNYNAVLAESLTSQDIANSVGVQGQVFTIVNDERYYYPDLIRGMIVQGDMGKNVTKYTGSTTGTSRDNNLCSSYSPITWQVDRKCHLISASSFDKMCADMLSQRDDMSSDIHPHGSREVVDQKLTVDSRTHDRRLYGSDFEIDAMLF